MSEETDYSMNPLYGAIEFTNSMQILGTEVYLKQHVRIPELNNFFIPRGYMSVVERVVDENADTLGRDEFGNGRRDGASAKRREQEHCHGRVNTSKLKQKRIDGSEERWEQNQVLSSR